MRTGAVQVPRRAPSKPPIPLAESLFGGSGGCTGPMVLHCQSGSRRQSPRGSGAARRGYRGRGHGQEPGRRPHPHGPSSQQDPLLMLSHTALLQGAVLEEPAPHVLLFCF